MLKKKVGKPTLDAAKASTNKISTFQWTFWQSPHRQSRNPARAVTPSCAPSGRILAGITSCSCPKHLGTASLHLHIYQAVQGASALFLKHPKVPSCWLRAVTGWEEGSFPPARWLHFPTARQQPQLTSTFTNRPAVQTALCELPFSCLYYGKHRSFW